MTYALAKELKDAGFPLEAASMEDAKDSKRKRQIFDYGLDSLGRPGSWLYPTLSELIEACGEEFSNLAQYKPLFEEEKSWYCNLEVDNGEHSVGDFYFKSKGSTPEEAVATLWLALNKKL